MRVAGGFLGGREIAEFRGVAPLPLPEAVGWLTIEGESLGVRRKIFVAEFRGVTHSLGGGWLVAKLAGESLGVRGVHFTGESRGVKQSTGVCLAEVGESLGVCHAFFVAEFRGVPLGVLPREPTTPLNSDSSNEASRFRLSSPVNLRGGICTFKAAPGSPVTPEAGLETPEAAPVTLEEAYCMSWREPRMSRTGALSGTVSSLADSSSGAAPESCVDAGVGGISQDTTLRAGWGSLHATWADAAATLISSGLGEIPQP